MKRNGTVKISSVKLVENISLIRLLAIPISLRSKYQSLIAEQKLEMVSKLGKFSQRQDKMPRETNNFAIKKLDEIALPVFVK